jgi:uncharacterized protein YraI
MLSATALLPAISLLKWPLTIAGAVLVFGLSTDGTLSLVSSNAHRFTKPIAAQSGISMPPVKQIGELNPMAIVPRSPASDVVAADASTGTQATQTVAAIDAAALPSLAAPMTPDPMSFQSARIGASAVNVRSGPSKSSTKLGVLAAGSDVRVRAREAGWVNVEYAGGDGWIHSDYLAANAPMSITVRGGQEAATTRSKGVVEIGSRMTGRAAPDGASSAVVRLSPGERVKVLERRGKWLRIHTASGETAWIRAK